MYDEFFSGMWFDEIPYFIPAPDEPSISIADAKDVMVEVYDPDTYELKKVNQNVLVNKEWDEFNFAQQFVSKRKIDQNSFHLIMSNVKLREPRYILGVIRKDFPELSLDTSALEKSDSTGYCPLYKFDGNEKFLVGYNIDSLTNEQRYNMRGLFRFGSVFYSKDSTHAVLAYDVYHKWINLDGEPTNMETGGGGVLVVRLQDRQVIERIIPCWEY